MSWKLTRLFSKSRDTRRNKKNLVRPIRLYAEQLEDRTLPSAVSFADPATEFLGNGKGGVVHLQLDIPVLDQTVVVDFSVAGTDSSGNSTSTSYEVSFAPGDTFLHTPILLPAVQQGDQETYTITVDSVTNADIGDPSTASVTVFADNTPTIANPGDQVNQHGDQVSLPIMASDPNFLPLTFQAD